MKKGKLLGILSICLFLSIIILFYLDYNAPDIIVDKNHYYCPNVVGLDLEGKVISNSSVRNLNFKTEK